MFMWNTVGDNAERGGADLLAELDCLLETVDEAVLVAVQGLEKNSRADRFRVICEVCECLHEVRLQDARCRANEGGAATGTTIPAASSSAVTEIDCRTAWIT